MLKQALPWLEQIERPQRPRRLPVILSVEEAQAVLSYMDGEHALLARLLYGTGMRIMEALRLRVKDVDFARRSPRPVRPHCRHSSHCMQSANLPCSTACRASRNAAAFQLCPAMPIGLSVRP